MDPAPPEQPLIDICMPTYEPNPVHLREAIASVFAQTEKRWRLCIHDDCSAADVRSMVEPWLQDNRVTFVKSSKRLGIGGNWNASVQLGSAPFVQFLFQDDGWGPDYLTSAVQALEHHPSAGMTAVAHTYAFEGKSDVEEQYRALQRFREEQWRSDIEEGRELLAWWIGRGLHPNIIGEPSFVLLKRSLLASVGPFAEDMPQFLDLHYWIRCLLHADCAFERSTRGFFRVHETAASARNRESGQGIYDRLRCFEELIRTLPKGPLRSAAKQARNSALDDMAAKFFRRLKKKESVPLAGSSPARRLALRHPLLLLRALLHGYKANPSS